jgi:hypothetical protein
MPQDADGFLVNGYGQHAPRAPLKAPPPAVNMPSVFDGCSSSEQAVIKMIDALAQPMSVNVHGHDAMYRIVADALTLLLAMQGGLAP